MPNGQFDYLANQQRLGSLFGERSAAVDLEQDQTRKNILAEAGMGAALTKTQLDEATNIGGLAALPQKLEIEKTDRDRKQSFQHYSLLKEALYDKALPQEARMLAVEKAAEEMAKRQAGPQDLRSVTAGQGRDARVLAQHYKEMYRNDPTAFEATLDKLLGATSATQESTNTLLAQREKDAAAADRTLLEGRYPPSEGGRGGSEEKLWKIALGEVDRTVKQRDNQIKEEAKNAQLKIIFDQLGKPVGVERIDGKPLTANDATEYRRIYEAAHNKWNPQIEAKQRGADTLAPAGYVTARDRGTQPQQAAPAQPQRGGPPAGFKLVK